MTAAPKRLLQDGFFDEADEHIATLVNLALAIEGGKAAHEDLDAIFRAAHSIKGGAATFGFRELAEATHHLESLLDGVRRGTVTFTPALTTAVLNATDILSSIVGRYRAESPVEQSDVESVRRLVEEFAAPGMMAEQPPQVEAFGLFETPRSTQSAPLSEGSSIRVDLRKIDHLINLVGELVIAQSVLAENGEALDEFEHSELRGAIEKVGRHTRDLREHVMGVRMVPIGTVFGRFPRMVHDLANSVGKRVRLDTIGNETELDKGLTERLIDPLTHLIRNAVDHGIESPEERERSGKPAEGTIALRAAHEAGYIAIAVSDDGAGLNRARIIGRARERGIAVADDAPDKEVWELIFAPGFSTADVVTTVSGRGVGMDVVRRNVYALQGSIEIHSEVGRGTTITVRMPLTLAILDGLAVRACDEVYIIPLTAIVESVPIASAEQRSIQGLGTAMYFRGSWVPVVSLVQALAVPGEPSGEGVAVVFEAGGKRAALLVDSLEAQHQVVIKSLEANFRPVTGIAGATVMGTGRVAFILDLAALVGGAFQ